MDRTVVGTVTGFEQRQGGWRRYSISEPGRQYPVKADTKKPEIIAQVDAYMQAQATVAVQINEADSGNPNPHQPGKNYINRYLNAIAIAAPGQVSEAAAVNADGAAAVAQPQGFGAGNTTPQGTQMISYEADRKERERQLQIMRENAMGHVIGLVAAGKVEGDSISMVTASEVFVAYYVYGPARFGVPAFDVGLEKEEAGNPAEAYAEQTMAEPVACPECGGINEVHKEGCSYDIPF